MFIGAGTRLEIGFNAAQARLANLARGGLVRRASEYAHAWGTDQAPVGAGGIAKLVTVQFRHLGTRENSAAWALRWETRGTTGNLFPVLDADITLTRAGAERPPCWPCLDPTGRRWTAWAPDLTGRSCTWWPTRRSGPSPGRSARSS